MKKSTKVKDLISAVVADGNVFRKIDDNSYELLFFQKSDEDSENVYLQIVSKIRFSKANLLSFYESVKEITNDLNDGDKHSKSKTTSPTS